MAILRRIKDFLQERAAQREGLILAAFRRNPGSWLTLLDLTRETGFTCGALEVDLRRLHREGVLRMRIHAHRDRYRNTYALADDLILKAAAGRDP